MLAIVSCLARTDRSFNHCLFLSVRSLPRCSCLGNRMIAPGFPSPLIIRFLDHVIDGGARGDMGTPFVHGNLAIPHDGGVQRKRCGEYGHRIVFCGKPHAFHPEGISLLHPIDIGVQRSLGIPLFIERVCHCRTIPSVCLFITRITKGMR